MSTQAFRSRMSALKHANYKPLGSLVFKAVAFSAALLIMSMQLQYIWKQHQVIEHQKSKLETLSTYCPDIKLNTRTFSATGSIESGEPGQIRKCIYDIEEHVLRKEMGRMEPKDSKYLRRN